MKRSEPTPPAFTPVLAFVLVMGGCASAKHAALHDTAGETIRSALERADVPNPGGLSEAIEWYALGEDEEAERHLKQWVAEASPADAASAMTSLNKLAAKLGPAKAGLRPVLAMLAGPAQQAAREATVSMPLVTGSPESITAGLVREGFGWDAASVGNALAALEAGDRRRAMREVEALRNEGTPAKFDRLSAQLERWGRGHPQFMSSTASLRAMLDGAPEVRPARPASPTIPAPTLTPAPAPTVAATVPVPAHAPAAARLSLAGEGCVRTADCEAPLGCIGAVCRPRARDVERERLELLANTAPPLWPCAFLASEACLCDRSVAGTSLCGSALDAVRSANELQACLVGLEPTVRDLMCGGRAALDAARAALRSPHPTPGKGPRPRPEALECAERARRVCGCSPSVSPAVHGETCRALSAAVVSVAAGGRSPLCGGNGPTHPAETCADAPASPRPQTPPVASVSAPAPAPPSPPAPAPPGPAEVGAPPDPGVPCRVAGKVGVRLRADPGHAARVTGSAAAGTALACFEAKAGWRRVMLADGSAAGYLPEKLIESPPPPPPPPLEAPADVLPTAPARARPGSAEVAEVCEALYRTVAVPRCGTTGKPEAYINPCAASFCGGDRAAACASEFSRTCDWDRLLKCEACR